MLGEDPKTQLEAAFCVRKLLSRESRPPTEAFLHTGVLRRVVELMRHTSEARMQFECAWILTNIASSEHTVQVVDAGAIPVLAHLLRSANVDVREQCIWCLGNVAGDGPRLRDAVLATEHTVPNIILNIQNSPRPSVQRNAVWALSNMARFKPAPSPRAVLAAAKAFSHLVMTTSDQEVLVDSCWGLQYVTDAGPELVDLVARSGVLPRLVGLMAEGSKSLGTPAVRCVGNIVGGDDSTTDRAIEAGVLEALGRMLDSPSRNHRREAAWALSNVAAGTKPQIARLCSTPGLLAKLVERMATDDQLVQNEACWTVCNVAASGSPSDVLCLAQEGAIRSLCLMLTKRLHKVLHISIGGLTAIFKLGKDREAQGLSPAFDDFYAEFEEAQGVEVMEELQDLDDEELGKKVDKFADDFLDVEDEEGGDGMGMGGGDENNVAEGGQAFSFGITSGAAAAASMKPPLGSSAGGGDGWGSFGQAASAGNTASATAGGETGGWGDFSGASWN